MVQLEELHLKTPHFDLVIWPHDPRIVYPLGQRNIAGGLCTPDLAACLFHPFRRVHRVVIMAVRHHDRIQTRHACSTAHIAHPLDIRRDRRGQDLQQRRAGYEAVDHKGRIAIRQNHARRADEPQLNALVR